MGTKNQLIKKQRTVHYFLEAAASIAEESGIDSITIRNVADRAGYNSATLYNYFENLDQLIAFTVIRHISAYLKEDSEIFREIGKNPVECYIKSWLCMCRHSFSKPELFSYVFANSPETMNRVLAQFDPYLELFPDTLPADTSEEFLIPYSTKTYAERDLAFIAPLIHKNLLTKADALEVLEFANILYDGLLHKAVYEKDKSPEEYTDLFSKYFTPFIKSKLRN